MAHDAAARRLPDVPRQAARRRPGHLHPPSHQGARRPRPPRRGVRRPAVPRARRSRRAAPAAQPRPVQRPLSRPLPRLLGAEVPTRTSSRSCSSPPARSPSRSPSASAPCGCCTRVAATSTSSTTTSASATASSCSNGRSRRSSRCTTRSPGTACWRWTRRRRRRKRWSVGRWYSFVEMQAAVASRMPRIVVGQRELDQRHPHRHGRQPRPHAPRAGRRRCRAVPTAPPGATVPGPADHDGIGRRRPQGPRLSHRGASPSCAPSATSR